MLRIARLIVKQEAVVCRRGSTAKITELQTERLITSATGGTQHQ